LEYVLASSYGFRVLSVILGHPKRAPCLSFSEVKKRANHVNPRVPSVGKVVVTAVPKPEGGERPIVIFGTIARANQSLARDLIHMGVGPSQFEFARKGRGREKLMAEINNANRNGGVRALGTFDIKNCFPSIRREAVASVVPLSGAIIRNTILISENTPISIKTDLLSEDAVRAGLSQGALSSPLVAGLVIAPCIAKTQARYCWSHIDDIIFGESDVGKVEALLDALADACLDQHPSSPLFEKCRSAFKIGKHADVLGYWPRPNKPCFGGGLRFSPSNKSIRRFYVKLATALLKQPCSTWDKTQEAKAYAYADSAKSWGGGKAGRENLITVFVSLIQPLLTEAHQEVQKAISAGLPTAELEPLAASKAAALVPATVIVNTNGFMKW
jgi:hypothetical protein